MRNTAVTALLLLFPFLLKAAEGEYAVSLIPFALLKNANAVIRLEETKLEIINTRETVTRSHYVITILNENGDQWAEFVEYYDKLREIGQVEGILYDAYGKQLKKIKRKDLQDGSAVSEGTLMDDSRYKRHNFYHRQYPYTIEYTAEIKNKSTLFFPVWAPQPAQAIAVEKSSMQVECPADYEFRFKAFNYTAEPLFAKEKNTLRYTWTARAMPAIIREPYSPLWHELTTLVIFGPTQFQVDGYKGNMKDWQDFGKFIYALKAGRDQLPEPTRQTVHRLTDGLTDPREKISRLYEYMQQNTRYISIQLGIGGWQPFDAKYVATKGYGDCKALTNYMYSLLKEVNIPSYYTLVRAGKQSQYITEDFPSQQFNHVILCVPLQKDTMWLECTSQIMPAGYLGDFTSDRPALLVDEQGGKLVRTPRYGLNDNQQLRHIKARLSADGTLQADIFTGYSALQQDDLHSLINRLSKDKVKEHLHEQLSFATYDINRFEYKEQKKSLPVIDEMLDITVSNYATVTGKRLFILPNLMTRSGAKLSADSTRKYDILLGYSYRDIDSVEIELPEGYQPESMPADVALSGQFGTYHSSVSLQENKLVYHRLMEQRGGRYPAKDYAALVQFYDAVYKADRNRVVLIKK